LIHVKDQTERICLEAVKENGNALRYVKEQTEEICLEAIRQNLTAIEYVDIKRFPKVFELYQFLIM
jgi:hypothetical protein